MAVDNNCSSQQTFCRLNRQTVSANNSIAFNYNGCITHSEIIEDETWNELIDAIIKVYNYGTRGVRNPPIPLSLSADTNISATTIGHETSPTPIISDTLRNTKHKAEEDQIDFNDYNQILSTIGITQLSEKQIIYGDYFNDIMIKLNNYQLNDTRCNNCNTGCNVTCQAIAQCCDSHCCTQCCTNCCTNACAYTCEASYDACTHGLYKSNLILKENIKPLNLSAIDLINDIQIVSFNYKNDQEKNYKVGFIADTTNEIFATKNHNVMDSYNCIGVLLKAIQELSQEINELKKNKKTDI